MRHFSPLTDLKFYFLIYVFLLNGCFVGHSQTCNQFLKVQTGNLTTDGFHTPGFSVDQGRVDFDMAKNMYVTGSNSHFVAKYDSLGNLIWAKNKPGVLACDLEVRGNYLYATTNNSIVIKYDLNGNEVFPPVTVANAEGGRITTDSLNNIYVLGSIAYGYSVTLGTNVYTPPTGNGRTFFLAKYNSSGQLQWSKHICPNWGPSVNASIAILKNFIYVVTPGNNMIAGTKTSTFNGMSLYKTDINGNDHWIRQLPSMTVIDMAINYQNKLVLTGSSNMVIADTSTFGTNNYTYPIPYSPIFQNIRVSGDNFAAIGYITNEWYTIWYGKFSNMSQSSVTHMDLPTSIPYGRRLIGFNRSGELFGFYSSTSSSNDTAYVDMDYKVSNGTKVVIAKYNTGRRLFPSFSNASVSCGTGTQLGAAASGYPYSSLMTFPSVTWTPSSGLSNANILNPVAQTSVTTSYTVNVDGMCSSVVTVSVNNPSSFSYTTAGMVATFSINNPGCSSFTWDFGNGNTSTINSNPVVTYATAGTYGVCLQCNGQPTSCVKCLNVTVPSNGSGAIGIEELSNTLSFGVYPNPSEGFLTIEKKNNPHHNSFLILNAIGETVIKGELLSEKNTVDISGLSQGVYLLQIIGPGNQKYKIIKR